MGIEVNGSDGLTQMQSDTCKYISFLLTTQADWRSGKALDFGPRGPGSRPNRVAVRCGLEQFSNFHSF